MTRDDLIAALTHDNVGAFLRVIREGESNQTEDAYRLMYGGKLFDAPPWNHPHIHIPLANGQTTSAAGAYQYEIATWEDLAKRYGFEDFSPPNQDQGAVGKLADRHALEDVLAGRLDEAIRKLHNEWTSLALAKRQAEAPAIFQAYGGRLAEIPPDRSVPDDPPPTQEVKHMGPFLIPFLEAAASLIPAIAKLGFGSGSEVAQRNVAAGAMVADAVVGAVKAGSHEEALTAIQNDSQALQAARDAASAVLVQLSEAGSGGIDGARKAAQLSDGDWKKVAFSGPFVLALLVLPLIYAVVLAALLKFEWLAEITSEVRTGVITSVTGLILGSLMGYFYGTSATSAKKDAALASK